MSQYWLQIGAWIVVLDVDTCAFFFVVVLGFLTASFEFEI